MSRGRHAPDILKNAYKKPNPVSALSEVYQKRAFASR